MVFCKLISISCVALLTCKVKASMDKATDENLKDLHFIQKNLDENIKPDLIKILSQQISLTKELNENLKQMKIYVEESIGELKEFVMKQMETSDNKIMENVNLLKENTKESFENITQMMFTNDQALNESSSIETDTIIEWAHGRFGKHEDIMRTHISICAFTFGHFGRGVVDYSRDADSGFLEETQYQIDNKTCVNNKDQCLENILNRQEGTFTVPENMAGVYEFTFTVLMDTFNHHLDASNYIFRKNGENIKGTDIYGEAGFNDSHDKILATRTINLFLQVGDKVDVDQITDSDTPDHRITFCGTLLHQDRASKTPAGIYADTEHPMGAFPILVMRELDTANYTEPVMSEVTYDDFEYTKKKTEEFEIKEKESILEIGDLGVEDETKWKEYHQGETHA